MKCWTVYCHIHVATQRKYIGLTSQTVEKRWKNHINAAKSSKGGRWHFPNAIRKYGPEAFESKVLGKFSSLEEANAEEKRLISKYDTRNPEKGFNLAKGGGAQPHPIRKNPWNRPEYRAKMAAVPSPFHTPQARAANKASLNTSESRVKRVRLSKEVLARPGMKEKLSAISKEIHARPEVKARMSAAFKGKKRGPLSSNVRDKIRASNTGKKHTAESRLKMSLMQIGKKRPSEIVERIAQKVRKYVTENGRVIYKICRVHGLVSVNDCHIGKYGSGNPRIMCGFCVRARGQELRRRMSAEKVKLSSEERGARISAALKGRKLSSEHRAKLSVANRLRKTSQETKEKLSAALKTSWRKRQAL